MTVTREDILAGKVRATGHYNGGSGRSGYPHQHIQYPRVGFVDWLYSGRERQKRDMRSERIWTLDGSEMESLDAVVAGLATPPVLSEREQAVLDLVPAQFVPLRELEKSISETLGDPAPEAEGYAQRSARDIMTLGAKGLVEIGRVETEPTEFMKATGTEHLAYIPTIRRTQS